MSSSPPASALRITNWPLQQQPLFAVFAALTIVALAVIARWTTDSELAGCVAAAILVLTTWRMWIPVHFELDAHGVDQVVWSRRTRLPWSRIARYEADPNGVLLLHQSDAFPLSALRGTYIHSPERREELLTFVHEHAALQETAATR